MLLLFVLSLFFRSALLQGQVPQDVAVGGTCAPAGDTQANCADVNAVCTGGHCTCKSGYTPSGTTCIPQDVAVGGTCAPAGDTQANCADVNAVCTGGHCTCKSGYTPSGTTCIADNPTVTTCTPASGAQPPAQGDCADPNSICSAARKCECKDGYSRPPGGTCIPQDVTVGNTCTPAGDTRANCADVNAVCTGAKCTCKSGYTPSGTTCNMNGGATATSFPSLLFFVGMTSVAVVIAQ